MPPQRDSQGRFVSALRVKGGPGGPLDATLRFDNRLREALKKIRKNTDEEVQAWGEDAADIAKRLAPRHDPRLIYHAESIVAFRRGATRRQGIASDSGRGASLEFGTRHAAAHPHMIPAVIIARDNTLDRIRIRKLTR